MTWYVEPSVHPLAYGVSARVGRLRGYGNAIVPQVAGGVRESIYGNRRGDRMTHWYGFAIAGLYSLNVGMLPGRKRPCLYRVDRETSTLTVLAFFKDVDAAKEALRLIGLLAEGEYNG